MSPKHTPHGDDQGLQSSATPSSVFPGPGSVLSPLHKWLHLIHPGILGTGSIAGLIREVKSPAQDHTVPQLSLSPGSVELHCPRKTLCWMGANRQDELDSGEVPGEEGGV
jgi:hypothetical protein